MPAHPRRTTALSAAILAVLGAAAPAAAAGAPAAALLHAPAQQLSAHLADPHGRILNSSSSNWAGYAATGSKFTSVTASWTQPSVSCSSSTAYSSFWVGLDGDGSNSVEQTGTEADCSGGSPVYSSWYEMYPKYPVNFSNPVKPGDRFTATVTTNGSGSFTLTLANNSESWTKTVNATLKSAALASAEVIAEAPSSSSGVLPLSDFGTVNFSGSKANGNAIGSYSPDQINMVSGSTTKATTSSLSGGTGFSVAWKHS
jgi:hypothetical protein